MTHARGNCDASDSRTSRQRARWNDSEETIDFEISAPVKCLFRTSRRDEYETFDVLIFKNAVAMKILVERQRGRRRKLRVCRVPAKMHENSDNLANFKSRTNQQLKGHAWRGRGSGLISKVHFKNLSETLERHHRNEQTAKPFQYYTSRRSKTNSFEKFSLVSAGRSILNFLLRSRPSAKHWPIGRRIHLVN